MKLNAQDVELFYKLNRALLAYINTHLKLVPGVQTIDDFIKTDFENKVKLRDALYENIALLDNFYEDNPFHFTEQELGIVLRMTTIWNGMKMKSTS